MKKLLLFIFIVSNYTYGQVLNRPQHDPPVVINNYAAVQSFDICKNAVMVDTATFFGPGDTVLLIQMKGAEIDTSNTSSFGTILDYKNAGNYEFNFISAKSGNQLSFKNRLTKTYDFTDGFVQLVRVPSFINAFSVSGFTCMPWNGIKGGILAVIATNSLTSIANIEVDGRGFRAGEGYNAVLPPSNCFQTDYNYPSTSQLSGFKGESIADLPQSINKGKGSPAAGGGAGLSHNSGGGGGANAGAGGYGGFQSDTCGAAPFDNRGLGGKNLLYTAAADKIFMGSGGGAGHGDNTGLFPGTPGGGTGGGIIIIITDTLSMGDHQIFATGSSGQYCYSQVDCNDGMGGGGAGGSVLLKVNVIIDSLTVQIPGGNGGNVIAPISPGGRVGPGGGGGGGAFFINTSSLPANVGVINNGGSSGVIALDAANAWGATAGADGIALFDLVLPWDTVLFKPNIDSVRMLNSVNYCNNIQFNGFGFTNTYPVASWQWYFGDGGTASTQNPVYNYNAVGNYTVKLIVTDINGCKDSITTTINTAGTMFADAGTDTAFCAGGPTSIVLNGNGTGNYSWSPASVLNNNTLQNPVATIDTTTKFYLTMLNGTGCSAADSVTITINKNPVVQTLADTTICKNDLLVLTTAGALNYNWSPGIYVSDSTIASPQYMDTVSHTLIVTGIGLNGCMASDTINISVNNRVTFIAPESKTICKGAFVQLNGNNGNAFQYAWSPTSYLNNAAIINPVANPPFTTAYTVEITDNICKYDSSFIVNVLVLPVPTVKATKSNDLNCNKPFAQLHASGASNYTWTPAYALSNDSIANPVANPAVTTTYYVNATDSTTCVGTDSITVIADFKSHGIILPNSFTPNNDGLNDCFGIRYHRDVRDLEFIIFNRYGIIVFKTNNTDECWDGNYKGKPAEQGNYVYFIKAKTLCGEVVMKESIMLIR